MGSPHIFSLWLWLSIIACGVLCTYASHREHDGGSSHLDKGFARTHWTEKFRDTGNEFGTDKTNGFHHYENIYGKYFAHDSLQVHGRTIKILEIGLGCNMGYGPGKSVLLWQAWFPSLDLHEMEYDAACVTKWKTKIEAMNNVTVHVGDQKDIDALSSLKTKAGVVPGVSPWLPGEEQFDIIIDDGGHYPDQIQTSFKELFGPALKPGGVYVIEDIAPMRKAYPGREYNDGLMITWVQGMMATLLGNAGWEPAQGYDSDPMNMHAPQAKWVLSAEVMRNAVAIVKASLYDCQQRQAYCPGGGFEE